MSFFSLTLKKLNKKLILVDMCENFRQFILLKKNYDSIFGQKFLCLLLIFQQLPRISIIRQKAILSFSETLKYILALIIRVLCSYHRSRFSLQIAVTKNKAPSLVVGFVETRVARYSPVLCSKPVRVAIGEFT